VGRPPRGRPTSATRRVVGYVDERTGAVPFVRRSLRYVFPDHWSFLLGEVALYSFLVLVGTGVYLTFFFEDSAAQTVYTGEYGPLVGHEMSQAYRSVLEISTTVKAGLLIRQTHHWAANVFIAAIVLHLARIFFTGAFRKPRDLTYYVGLTMLVLALLEGYLGYSLVDDAFHNLLDRPRDAPWRTAIGSALAACVVIVFLAGSMDRADVTLGLSYERQLWVYRVLVFVLPPVVLFVTLRVCRELRAGEQVERRRRAAERAARLDV
jgi:quinol-cytochrome oxidoreductase complex cytochrome b subunit